MNDHENKYPVLDSDSPFLADYESALKHMLRLYHEIMVVFAMDDGIKFSDWHELIPKQHMPYIQITEDLLK